MFGFGKPAETVVDTPTNEPTKPEATTTPAEPELSEFDKITALLYPKKNGNEKTPEIQEPSEPFDATTLFNNPEIVDKLRSSVDFSKSISSETQQLLEAGDPKGFMSAMQDISKASFLEALKVSAALNKTSIEDAVKRTIEQSKGQITQSLEDFDLQKEIPQINNPVIRLGLEAAKKQLKEQNPSMSASDLAKHLKGFLAEANKMVNSQSPAASASKEEEPVSWEDWLSV